MSTRNPKNWTAIREIVRRGQDTLYRLKLGREWQNVVALVEHYYNPPGTSYPQSLGELCIELAQEAMLEKQEAGITEYSIGIVKKEWTWPYNDSLPPDEWAKSIYESCRLRISRRDIQELRRVMYHKHKDPVKEKKLDRIEGILSMVINDLSCGELCKPAVDPRWEHNENRTIQD